MYVRHRRRQRGLTLVELLVTLAIIGIMIGVVFPGFNGIMARNSLATTANEMVLAINLARSQAVREGQPTQVVATDASAASNEWGPGWSVLDGSGTVIRIFEPISDALTLDGVDGVAAMQFDPNGMSTGGAATLNLCYAGDSGVQIDVAATGRAGTRGLDADDCPSP